MEKLLWQLSKVALNPKQQKLLEDLAVWAKEKGLSPQQEITAGLLYKQLRFHLILNVSAKLALGLIKTPEDMYFRTFIDFLNDETFSIEDRRLIIQESIDHYMVRDKHDELVTAYRQALSQRKQLVG